MNQPLSRPIALRRGILVVGLGTSSPRIPREGPKGNGSAERRTGTEGIWRGNGFKVSERSVGEEGTRDRRRNATAEEINGGSHCEANEKSMFWKLEISSHDRVFYIYTPSKNFNHLHALIKLRLLHYVYNNGILEGCIC